MAIETAIFAAGCFWGVEAAFRELKGVLDATVGYTGGHKEDPNYKDVCTGNTGHAEACEVKFDNEVITFDQLLDAFWKMHDPTQLNRQGPDIGTQYRSAVFFHSPEQEEKTKASMKELFESKKTRGPICTQVVPAQKFWPAEEYHQNYCAKTGRGFCHM